MLKKSTPISIGLFIPVLFITTLSPVTIHCLSLLPLSGKLDINILGEPFSNTTYIEMDLQLSSPVTGVIEVPLILDNDVAILNVTGIDINGNSHELIENTSIDYTLETVIITVYRIVFVSIKLFSYGAFNIEGIDTYSIEISLSRISEETSISCNFMVVGNYTPVVVSLGSYSIIRKPGVVAIKLNDREDYLIILYSEEEPLPFPQEELVQNSDQPITPKQLLPLLFVLAVILGLSLYYLRRKTIVVEEVSSKDILMDDVAKKIVEAVGDAGEEGLVQARLPIIIGKPKSTISRKVKKLSREGYITVSRRGKTNILKLTSKGLEVYRKIKGRS